MTHDEIVADIDRTIALWRADMFGPEDAWLALGNPRRFAGRRRIVPKWWEVRAFMVRRELGLAVFDKAA